KAYSQCSTPSPVLIHRRLSAVSSRCFCRVSLARTFLRKQRRFTRDTPAIACEITVFPDRAMARYQQCDLIRGDSARDGAHRARFAGAARDLAVTARGSVGNGTQDIPHLALEYGGIDVERQVKIGVASREIARDAPREGLHPLIVAHQRRRAEFSTQLRFEPGSARTEGHAADTALSGRQQYLAARRCESGERNRRPAPLVAVARGRHAELR